MAEPRCWARLLAGDGGRTRPSSSRRSAADRYDNKGEARMQDHASGGTVEQRRSVLTTLALGLSTFLILFDVTAVVVAMPAIAKDVGLGVAGLAWVIDAYSLAFTGALLASGALGRPLRSPALHVGRQCGVSRRFGRVRDGFERTDAPGHARRTGSRRRLHGHGRDRTRRNRLSERRSAGPCVRRHGGDRRRRHGTGADPRGLPRRVARLALDLFCKHPLLPGAGPGGAAAGRRDERQGRATAGSRRHRLADDFAGLGDRCAAEARRLPGPQSRLPRWQYGNGGPVHLATMAQSAPGARSPPVRDLDHGRGRRVADRPPVRLLGRAGLSSAFPECGDPHQYGGGRRGPAGSDAADAAGTADRRPARDALGMASASSQLPLGSSSLATFAL